MVARPTPNRYCHACGGPNPDATAQQCCYCGGPLVPLGAPDPREAMRCSACAKMVAIGSSFCPGCGAALASVGEGGPGYACPGCAAQGVTDEGMATWGLTPTPERPQGHPVHACRRCGGVWVDVEVLEAILRGVASESGSVAASSRGPTRRVMARGAVSGKVVYRRCAVCNELMMRRNFGRVSGVVVDECGRHGSYFDAGELEDVLAFVRSGGLHAARRHADEEHNRLMRHKLEIAALEAPAPGGLGELPSTSLADGFARFFGRWISSRF